MEVGRGAICGGGKAFQLERSSCSGQSLHHDLFQVGEQRPPIAGGLRSLKPGRNKETKQIKQIKRAKLLHTIRPRRPGGKPTISTSVSVPVRDSFDPIQPPSSRLMAGREKQRNGRTDKSRPHTI